MAGKGFIEKMENETAVALTLFCLFGAGHMHRIQLESLLRSEAPALQEQKPADSQKNGARNEKSMNAPDIASGLYRPGAGTLILVELVKPLEAKKLKLGDVVECRLTQDLLFKGKIIIPRKAKAQGHVTEIVLSSKSQPGSRVGLVFDRIVLPDKRVLPFQYPAIVVAIAAPIKTDTVRTSSPGDMPVLMSKGQDTGASITNAVGANAQLAGANMPSVTGAISIASRGVIGLKGVALDNSNSGYSAIVAEKGNVHLDFDVQFLLQVSGPAKKP